MVESFQDQTVLVTGASGFIGSHLTKRLLHLGAQVHIIVPEKSDLWRLNGISGNVLKVWRADLNDVDRLSQTLKQIRPNRVFHLGALVSADRNFALINEMIDVNIKGTLNLITLLQDLPCDCVINFGTCEEYGNGKAPFSEMEREHYFSKGSS